jgi:hypothetical protein
MYSDATVTIGGIPIAVESLSYQELADNVRGNVLPVIHTVSASCEILASSFHRLLAALGPLHRGASDATLCRRVFYGGKKGRRALRRLYARGYDGVAMTSAGPMLLPDGFRASLSGGTDRG